MSSTASQILPPFYPPAAASDPHSHKHTHILSPTHTRRPAYSIPSLSSSLTSEPPTWKSYETLAQTWSSISWAHNCSSLVNDRLCNLIPHTLGFFWSWRFPLLHLDIVPDPNCTSCFWQPVKSTVKWSLYIYIYTHIYGILWLNITIGSKIV